MARVAKGERINVVASKLMIIYKKFYLVDIIFEMWYLSSLQSNEMY